MSACVVQVKNEQMPEATPTPTPEINPNDTDSSEFFLTEYTCVAEIASKQVGKTVDGNKVILFWAVPSSDHLQVFCLQVLCLQILTVRLTL